MAKTLLREGIPRNTRGMRCFEMPHPVMIKINNPTARIVTIPERKWNLTLPYAESLWIASGQNDLDTVKHYVKRLSDFSDDGLFLRGAYGPRFRSFTGVANDYAQSLENQGVNVNNGLLSKIDQFEFVVKSFERDAYTRQAIIGVIDPPKDFFESNGSLKKTRDFPCTKDLHFQRNGDKLDLIVAMRSNDFLLGAGGVNIFNFTFMQEYFAQILGLEIGAYYHLADNLHFYDSDSEKIQAIAAAKKYQDERYVYKRGFNSLAEFDHQLSTLKNLEHSWRTGQSHDFFQFNNDFFNDWALVLYQKNVVNKGTSNFVNPVLEKLSKASALKKTIK
jgi:thymidylate synthase